MFNLKDAYYVASILNVKFDKFTIEEFLAMAGFAPAEDKLCAASLEDIL